MNVAVLLFVDRFIISGVCAGSEVEVRHVIQICILFSTLHMKMYEKEKTPRRVQESMK